MPTGQANGIGWDVILAGVGGVGGVAAHLPPGLYRPRMEQDEVCVTVAAANFVISPGHDPWGGAQQIFCRIEEVLPPRLPVIIVVRIGIALKIGRPIAVIAHMNNEIWEVSELHLSELHLSSLL